jgi:phosphoadenosine phosphosulfate reductase
MSRTLRVTVGSGERLSGIDLGTLNLDLSQMQPAAVAAWALSRSARPMVTTSFGLHAAAMLHLVSRIRTGVPVVWIDTGFNTTDTYRHAELLARAFSLDLRIYAPDVTRARLEATLGGVPSPDAADRHAAFSTDIKLRPFERALTDLNPDLWLTGIRREETDWRRTQNIVTRSDGGLLRVAPFFNLSEAELETYMRRHSLPFGDPLHYDPVKAAPHRECGLHQRWSDASMNQ